MSPKKIKINEYLVNTLEDINIIEFKITSKKNVLVYTNSKEDNDMLVYNINLFDGVSRINLNSIDKRPYILIKNTSYDFAKDKLEEL